MSGRIPRFSAAAEPGDVAAALRRDGAAIVEKLIPESTCARLEDELAPWMARTSLGADPYTGEHTRRTGAILARSVTSRELVAHPLVLGSVKEVLNKGNAPFHLHLTQAISVEPGAVAQALHRDQWCFDFFPFPDDYHVEVASMWALDEFTEANGATRVAVASHHGPFRLGEEIPTEPAEMPRGSVLLYTGATVHGAGANESAVPRTGINIDYALGWLRQEENQYLSVPMDVVMTLPEDLQRLIGYTLGSYALGYVDDVRDPMELLRPTGSRVPNLVPSGVAPARGAT